MKKIMLFIVVLLFPFFIFAKEYEVKDINIKVEIKDDFIVLTRDNLDNNSDLASLNISKENMEQMMKTKNIYFDIIKKDISYELLVVVPDTILEYRNLNNADDKMLNDLKEEIVKTNGAENANIYKSKHNYIMVDYYDSDTKYYIINYYTIVNARGYNFQLQKKSAITEEDRKDLKNIIDTVNIEVLDEYKDEIITNEKKSFDWKNVLYGALIGALAGLLSYIIGVFIKKKKSSM